MTDWPTERIRAVKEALGLTSAELATEIDVSERTVRSWLYEGRNPSKYAVIGLERLEKWAEKRREK